ncbi:uncharacterized protein N7506_000174 [Penicillium brevicompactum]|uniref:uncharacterized protein n=1 Tax=Penicillium brevicompactum TaxID=5074 RepID=UPI002541DCA6|nr:uncharacterized protein N7506_000174 [Penicillium brevicompactum]KAJ5346921.1 hypothetical protein N7506_000174 [Penicillium brevicompactum]
MSKKDPRERPLILYTDGSGIYGRIGAAAVVDLEDQHAHNQMGDDKLVVIFVDSQAALKVLRRPRMPSGQVYLAGCLGLIQRLAGRDVRIELRWIRAHQGVIGNEIVYQHAKEAAQEPDGPQNPLNRGTCLAAAAKRQIRRKSEAGVGQDVGQGNDQSTDETLD